MNTENCFSIKRLRVILIAFYRWLKKININAHQQIAYWRSRIGTRVQNPDKLSNKKNTDADASNGISSTELKQYNPTKSSYEGPELGQDNDECKSSSPNKRGSSIIFKTPRNRRYKLTSIFRRLSLRNFMDYCVAALNEASSSGCSNKFDLSSCDATVWLLGHQYDLPTEKDQFSEDIKSKLWITYRRNFPPIDENTRYTTDRGFGCMIRCGQMVLANALLCKNLTREWRWSESSLKTNPSVYCKILKLFQDRHDCPYSIHRIVQTGQKHEGKSIGEWFGPNTIAQALKRLSSSYQRDGSFDEEMLISIDAALDNIVVIDEIKSRFTQDDSQTASSNNLAWIPGILFIQLRLGLTKINPLYFAALKKTFQFKNSLGIIGGRPNHALYLVGYTDDDIIYLDPHNTQQYIDLDETEAANADMPEFGQMQKTKQSSDSNKASDSAYANFEDLGEGNNGDHYDTNQGAQSSSAGGLLGPPDESYHCSSPEKMSLDRLDPSLALCFYFGSESEFDDWCNQSQELLVKSEQAPMFEITKSRPCDWNAAFSSTTSTKTVTKDRKNMKSNSSSSDHDEEFEILT